jgi:uncharacterized protein YbaP (TraB family)
MSTFFKITINGKVSYILGTLHSGDKDIVTLSSEVREAFDQAPTFACELDESEIDPYQLDLDYKYQVSQWTKMHITADNQREYTDYKNQAKVDLTQILQIRSPEQSPEEIDKSVEMHLANSTPMQTAFLISSRDRSQRCLDEQLCQQAAEQKKTTISLDNQGDMINLNVGYHFNLRDQIAFYNESLNPIFHKNPRIPIFGEDGEFSESGYKNTRSLKELYLSGSVDKITALFATQSDVFLRFNDQVLAARDLNFVEKIKPLLTEGGAFIAVGVAHLPGMRKKLLSEGYQVEEIRLSERVYPISIDNFATLINEKTIEQLPVFLDRVINQLLPNMLNSTTALIGLFGRINQAAFEIVLSKLDKSMPSTIGSLQEFQSLINCMFSEQAKRSLILKGLAAHVIGMLKNSDELARLCYSLTETECNALYTENRTAILRLLMDRPDIQDKFSEARNDITSLEKFTRFSTARKFAMTLLEGNNSAIEQELTKLIAMTKPVLSYRWINPFFPPANLTTGELRNCLINLSPPHQEKIIKAMFGSAFENTDEAFKAFVSHLLDDSPQKAATMHF